MVDFLSFFAYNSGGFHLNHLIVQNKYVLELTR